MGLDLAVILDLKDFAAMVESNTVVILDASVLGVSHVDLAIFKQINFVLLKFILVVVGSVIEESSLHLSAFLVDQLNVEESTFRSRILPHLLGMLLSDSSFDLPVEEESVQGLDRSEALVI